MAEAQQAIQLLLARGFSAATVELSTPASPGTAMAGKRLLPSPQSDRSSGRFVSSLFDSQMAMRSQNSILVSVQTQSAAQAQQVTDLLVKAGAVDEDDRMHAGSW